MLNSSTLKTKGFNITGPLGALLRVRMWQHTGLGIETCVSCARPWVPGVMSPCLYFSILIRKWRQISILNYVVEKLECKNKKKYFAHFK